MYFAYLEKRSLYLILLLFGMHALQAQERPVNLPRSGGGSLPGQVQNRVGQISGGFGSGTADSLQRRDRSEDSITISYVIPGLTQQYKLDSSLVDFSRRFPIPAHHQYLGNTGTASYSMLFQPRMRSGWDHGFHGYDVYRWDIENVRYFTSTRPFTQLGYALGSRTEQVIDIMHTQNIRPGWNMLLQYRLINSPGFFKNQRTNHNNYLVSSWYQSVNKRYNNYIAVTGNALQSEENGGIREDRDYLNNPIYNDRYNIPTKLGGDAAFNTNFFASNMNTGNRHTDLSLQMIQHYDLGKKDSIVGDSVIIPLFYPRLRFEHLVRYSRYKFKYIDFASPSTGYDPDPDYYRERYGFTMLGDSLMFFERWKEWRNEFSIYQYPDSKNLQQFIKLGAMLQNLSGEFTTSRESFYNIAVHGEYRNKTRNRKWDMVLGGRLFLNGLNSGDYEVNAALKRFVGNAKSSLELGFVNTNRSPSFLFDSRSSFNLDFPVNLNKENISRLTAVLDLPLLDLQLGGSYYLFSNYTYLKDFNEVQQESALFNMLQLSAEKAFRLTPHLVWRSGIWFQQKAGNVELNLPLIWTRNRIGYEGKLGFKNLDIAMGLESRYHTPYNADDYSPVHARFFYQDTVRIANLPDLATYVHFRIRTFTAFVRAENLQTITTRNGFGFRNNNLGAPAYPYPGLQIRVAISWQFVN